LIVSPGSTKISLGFGVSSNPEMHRGLDRRGALALRAGRLLRVMTPMAEERLFSLQ
jgi:hypothetical protein